LCALPIHAFLVLVLVVGRASTMIYTLSLHAALPILDRCLADDALARRLAEISTKEWARPGISGTPSFAINGVVMPGTHSWAALRSEEHTSELQSRENNVCRLLLEKKKRNQETTINFK